MTTFDYVGWVTRAQAFTDNLRRVAAVKVHPSVVVPPASEEDVAAVERALGTALPVSLREFFMRGAAGVDCRYTLEPTEDALIRLQQLLPYERRIYGGARIGPLSDLPDLSNGVAAWATETWIDEDEAQKRIWESSSPFFQMDNGDYLALDLRSDATDPPVVYLNHDDESVVIAHTLGEFLRTWEGLCYLGPEHWLLLEFVGADGHLDASGDRAERLRQLLAAP